MLDREENPRYGLDLESWIAEALIDTLIPYTDLPELDCMGLAWEDEEAVSHFVDLVEGTNCQIALNVMPRHMSPEALRRLGHGEEIEQWRQLGGPNLASASVPLHRVGDYDLTYQIRG